MKSVLILILPFIIFPAISQKEFSADISIATGLSTSSGSFADLPGIPNCCPEFSQSTGFLKSLEGTVGRKHSNEFGISIYAGIEFDDIKMRETEAEVLNVGGLPFNGKFEHVMNFNYTGYYAGVSADYSTVENMNMSLGPTLYFSNHVQFSQYERIIYPEDRGVFIDTETRTRNRYSGRLTDSIGMVIGLAGGIEYAFPLNNIRSFEIVPKFRFHIPFNSLYNDILWRKYNLTLGFSIRYNLGLSDIQDTLEIPSKTEPEDPVVNLYAEDRSLLIEVGKYTYVAIGSGDYFSCLKSESANKRFRFKTQTSDIKLQVDCNINDVKSWTLKLTNTSGEISEVAGIGKPVEISISLKDNYFEEKPEDFTAELTLETNKGNIITRTEFETEVVHSDVSETFTLIELVDLENPAIPLDKIKTIRPASEFKIPLESIIPSHLLESGKWKILPGRFNVTPECSSSQLIYVSWQGD